MAYSIQDYLQYFTKKKLAIRFSHLVVGFRPIFVSLFVLISIFFLYVIKDIDFHTNIDDFYPQKHKFVTVQNKLTKIFGGLNQVSIAIRVKEGDILNPETLAWRRRISTHV